MIFFYFFKDEIMLTYLNFSTNVTPLSTNPAEYFLSLT